TEHAWLETAPDRAVGLAACLGLKEAAIKALGGRPPGFAWPDLGRDALETPPPRWLAGVLRDLGANDVATATMRGHPGAWGRADEVVVAVVSTLDADATVAAARVEIGADVAHGLTPGELAYAGSSASRRAGRQAARSAVLRLPGLKNVEVETLPGIHPPTSTRPCRGGTHAPRVVIDGRESDVGVSISHCPSMAVAVAWRA
ncbi:MAG: hypothetical protein QOI61_1838, partial [Actinomycetota bacterium]